MGAKKSTVKSEEGKKQTIFTEKELSELKDSSEDKEAEFDCSADGSEEMGEDTPSSTPKAVSGTSLSVLNEQIKKRLKAEGKSTRVVDSDSQRRNAISRLVTALNKRGWVVKGVGIYELDDKHKLSINDISFEADVDGHTLPLGKGALKILDQYVSLSKVKAADASSL